MILNHEVILINKTNKNIYARLEYDVIACLLDEWMVGWINETSVLNEMKMNRSN